MGDDTFAKLEAEYCPPLDPALLAAILYDFDLVLESQIQEARQILDSLKESAALEEDAGFDTSGTGTQDGGLSDSRPDSGPEGSAPLSEETDVTSLSNGLSSLDVKSGSEDDTNSSGVDNAIEALSEDTKIQLLLDVFQDKIGVYSATHTLRKCGGKWHSAMEELLSYVYFNDCERTSDRDKISAKGVDGFAEEYMPRRGRKGKSKKKQFRQLEERSSSSSSGASAESISTNANKWQTAARDIEFITTRTKISAKTANSTYYSSGASLSKTISAILKDTIQKDPSSDDPILAVNAYDLGKEFPSISPDYVKAIIQLTHPSTAAAHEFAKALTVRPPGPTAGLQIIPNYVRPQDTDLGGEWETVPAKVKSPNSVSNGTVANAPGAAVRASAYAAARTTALEQAQAAHRKAKSNRLMGGAAAYYHQVSRDYSSMSLAATAQAADELAALQSTASEVDLHGIDVLNAVRISQEKVEQWWGNMGEMRSNGRLGAEERQSGYRIIVGLGRHSEGGKGKLGPAVSKMLSSRGWKIEAAGAVIVVRGRTPR